ncbi:putative lipoprotein [Mycoplasmopsis columbina SF7]|uniref:Putative lipoprotein n=1 Tax=Mycoplasmopsis columbina SF7 TaxID=1037410 RepID=F9UKT6_9BACT|nr:lipoprotein 17-related variable surface protein [Mycoplasmopsis columbina]EGU99997.1 putative lipoprotein [Mycoplasmopsis columbina SF7]
MNNSKSKKITKTLALTTGILSSATLSLFSLGTSFSSNSEFNEVNDFESLSPVFDQNLTSKNTFLADETLNNAGYDYKQEKIQNYITNTADLKYSSVLNDKVVWQAKFNSGHTYEKDNFFRYTSDPGFGIFLSDDLKIDGPIYLNIKNPIDSSSTDISFSLPDLVNGSWEGTLDLWPNHENEFYLYSIKTTEGNHYTSNDLYNSIINEYGMDQRGENFKNYATENKFQDRVGTVLWFRYRTNIRNAKFTFEYSTTTRNDFQARIWNEPKFQVDSASFVASTYFAKRKYNRSTVYKLIRKPKVNVKLEATNVYPDRRDYSTPGIIYTLYRRKSGLAECQGNSALGRFDQCFDKVYQLPSATDVSFLTGGTNEQVKRKYELNLDYAPNLKNNNTNDEFVWVTSLDSRYSNSKNWNQPSSTHSFAYDATKKTFILNNNLTLKDEIIANSDEKLNEVELKASKYIKHISDLKYLPDITDNKLDLNDSLLTQNVNFLKVQLNQQRQQLYASINSYLSNSTYSKYKDNPSVKSEWNEIVNLNNEIENENQNLTIVQLRNKLKTLYDKFNNLQNKIAFLPLNQYISNAARALDLVILADNPQYSVPKNTPLPTNQRFFLNSWQSPDVFSAFGINNAISRMTYNTNGADGVKRDRIISLENVVTWNNYTYATTQGIFSLTPADTLTVRNHLSQIISEWRNIKSQYYSKFLNNTLTKEESFAYANAIKDFYLRYSQEYEIGNVSSINGAKTATFTLAQYVGTSKTELENTDSVRPLLVYRFLNDNAYFEQMREFVNLSRNNNVAYIPNNSILPLFGFSKQDFIDQINYFLDNFKKVQGQNYSDSKEPNVNQSLIRFIIAATNATLIDSWLKYKDTTIGIANNLQTQRDIYKNDLRYFVPEIFARTRNQNSINRLDTGSAKNILAKANAFIQRLDNNIETATPLLGLINSTADIVNVQVTHQKNYPTKSDLENSNEKAKIDAKRIPNDVYESANLFEILLKKHYANELNQTNKLITNELNSKITSLKNDWINKMNEIYVLFSHNNSSVNTGELLANNGSSRRDSNQKIDWISYFQALNSNTIDLTDSYRNNLLSSWNEMREKTIEIKKQLEAKILADYRNETNLQIDKLYYLSPEVRAKFKNKVNQETNFDIIDNIFYETKEYDDYVHETLLPLYEANKNIKQYVIYKNAAFDKRNNFNSAFNNILNAFGTVETGYFKDNNDSLNGGGEKHHQLALIGRNQVIPPYSTLVEWAETFKNARKELNGFLIANINFNGNKQDYRASEAPEELFEFTLDQTTPLDVEDYSRWKVRIKNFYSVKDKTGRTGSLKINYEVFNPNTNQWFDAPSDGRVISGFLTEEERLKKLYQTLTSNETNFADKNKLAIPEDIYKKFPGELTDENYQEFINILNQYYAQFGAQVVDAQKPTIISGYADDIRKGNYKFNYNLVSTVNGYTDVRALSGSRLKFGFYEDQNNSLWNSNKETERMAEILEKINSGEISITFNLQNKENYSAFTYLDSNLRGVDKNDISITVGGNQAQFIDQSYGWSFRNRPNGENGHFVYYVPNLNLVLHLELINDQTYFSENKIIDNNYNDQRGDVLKTARYALHFGIFTGNKYFISANNLGFRNNVDLLLTNGSNYMVPVSPEVTTTFGLTEAERLNQIINNEQVSSLFNSKIAKLDKRFAASEYENESYWEDLYNDEVLKQVTDPYSNDQTSTNPHSYTFLDSAEIDYDSIAFVSDDRTGTLTLTYKIKSKANIDPSITSESKTLVVQGFRNTVKVQNELNTYFNNFVSVDYANKDKVPTETNFDFLKYIFKFRENEQEVTFEPNRNSFGLASSNFEIGSNTGPAEDPEAQPPINPAVIRNSDIQVIRKDDENGSITIKYRLSSNDEFSNSLRDETTEWSNEIVISGFKTEQQRLNEILNNKDNQNGTENSVDTSNVDLDNKESRLASTVTVKEIENKLNNLYTPRNAKITDVELNPNDQNGQVDVTYKLLSTKTDLTHISSSETKTITFSNFKDSSEEERRLNNYLSDLDSIDVQYSDLNQYLAWPTFKVLDPKKLTFSIEYEDFDEIAGDTTVLEGNDLVFKQLNAKVVDIEFDPINNLNDKTGSIGIKFKLQSLNPNFNNTKSTIFGTKTIYGFNRETERLSNILTNLTNVTNENVSAIVNKNQSAEDITKEEIINALNTLITTSDKTTQAFDLNSDYITLIRDAAAGTVTVKWNIVSTREQLNGKNNSKLIISRITKTTVLSGFSTIDSENQRLSEFINKISGIRYKNSQNYVPSDALNDLNWKEVEITFTVDNQDYVAKYDENHSNALVFENNPFEFDIRNIHFALNDQNNTSDRNGTLLTNFDLVTTKTSAQGAQQSVTNKEISNFKTEKTRLDDLINQNLHTNISFDVAQKAKLPSQLTQDEVLEKFKTIFGSTNSVPNILSFTTNDQNGTLTINYELKSTKANLTDIKSITKENVVFDNFSSLTNEKSRLDNLLNTLNDVNFDYSPKTDTPQLTSLVVENLLWKVQNEEDFIAGNAANEANNIKLSDVTFSEKDDVNGTLKVRYRLLSTQEGYSSVYSEYKEATIRNFLTEAQRLTNILKAPQNDPTTKSYLSTAFNDKIASQVTKEQVLVELNKEFQNDQSQIDLNSIDLVANDQNGTLAITYKLVSTRANLTNVYSNETKTVTLTNLRSNTSEENRINNLATNVSVNYSNKEKTPLLTTFNNALLTFTINDEVGTYDESDNSFTFTNNKVKIKDITFKNHNDAGDNTHSDNSGSVVVSYSLYSNETVYQEANIHTNAQEKTITGFKVEQQRINEVKEQLASEIDPSTFVINKQRTANEVTDNEIITLIQNSIGSNYLATTSPNPTITRDVNEGTINVVWNVASTRDGFNASSNNLTQSQSAITTTISGFITSQEEERRLTEIKAAFTSANYAEKTALPTATTFVINHLTALFNYQNANATFTFDNSKPDKLITSDIPNVEISNVIFATAQNSNDVNGEISVTFELHSTKAGFENLSQTITTTLTGFKTEAERLNEAQIVVNETLDLAATLKTKPASSITQADIQQAIISAYRDSNATFDETNSLKNVNDSEPVVTLKANDENGTLEIKYVVKSTRDDLTNIYASTPITKVFIGFVTKEQEKNRLNNLIATINANAANYRDKSNLPSATSLTRDNLEITIESTTKTAGENDAFDAPLNVKVIPATDQLFSDLNDELGTIKATVKLQSTIFADIVSNSTKEFTISGFKTEQERLNEVLNSRTASKEFEHKNTITPSTITKAQVENLFNQLYTNDQAEVDLDSINLSADNANGTLAITYKLVSTKDNLTHIKSSETRSLILEGFKTTADEQNRLNELITNATVDYRNKTQTPSDTTKNKADLIITINEVQGTYDQASDSFIFGEPVNAKAINVNFSNNNDREGKFDVTFDLVSTNSGYENSNVTDSSQNKVKTIISLQTEQQRLDAVLTAKNDAINNADFTEVEKTKAPSTISDEDIIALLNRQLTSTDSTISSNDLVGTISKNNETGEITVKFKTHSTRSSLEDIQSSTVVTKTFTGFKTNQNVKDELDTILADTTKFTLDYADKATWPTNTNFALEHLLATLNVKNTNVTGSYTNSTFTFDEPVNAKVESVTYNNKNDRAGSVDITIQLRSTLPGFENVVSEVSQPKTVTSFKTEIDRLNIEIDKYATNDNVTFDNQANVSASTITATTVAEKLNVLYTPSAQANVVVSDINLIPNNQAGTLTIVYKLTSQKANLTDLKSKERTLNISGFLSNDNESRRLETLAQSATVDYSNKANLMAQKDNSQLNLENLKVTINDQVGTYNSTTQAIEFASPIDAKITAVSFNEANDANGSVKAVFKLVSTKEGLGASESSQQTKEISGFKVEQTRLNELLTAKTSELNNLQDPAATNKTASELTREEAAKLLSTIYANDEAQVRVQDIQSFNVNNETGEVTVTYKNNSKRAGLETIQSSQTQTKVFSGYITNNQETNRLNELLTKILENLDYTDKDNWPTATSFGTEQVTYQIDNQSYSGLRTIDNLQIEIANIEFSNPNDREGKESIKITLNSTKRGLESITVSNQNSLKEVDGFKTEVDRLNRLLITEQGKQPQAVDISNVSPNDKASRAASTYQNSDIETLLNNVYRDSQAHVSNINLSHDNEAGSLTITYKLTSDKTNLTNIESSKTKTFTIRGFKANNSEKARLDELLTNVAQVQATYSDKNNTPLLTTFDLANLTLTINGVQGTYDAQSQSFNFGDNVNVKASEITFINKNDVAGTLQVQIGKLTSLVDGYSTISSSDNLHAVKDLDSFLTESQRLDALANNNQGITYLAETAQNTKLASSITTNDLTFETVNTTNNWYKLLPTDATLEANDKTGTLTITLVLTSTRSETPNVKSTQKRTITLSSFKTAYQDAIDKLNNLDKNDVVINPPSNNNSVLPNSDGAKNKDNYNGEVNNNDSNITAEIVGIVGYDEINGRTLVAYKLVDNNSEHLDANNQKPTSKVFFKVVNGFKTEAERLSDLKTSVNENYTYTSTDKPKSLTFADAVQTSDFTFNSTFGSENKVTLENAAISANNATGEVVTSYKLATTKAKDELFKVDNSSLDSTAQNDLATFAQENFITPTENDYHVTVDNSHSESGFLTNTQDLNNKINQAIAEINGKENLSSEEKTKLIADLNAAKNTFDNDEAVENNQTAYQKAINTIDAIKNKSTETDNSKAEKINQVDTVYPNLNKAQRDQVKENIKNSNTLTNINDPKLPTTTKVESDASALNQAMGQLATKAGEESTIKADNKYINASDELKALYDAAIQAVKDLIPTANSTDGQNTKTPDLTNVSNWNTENATKPGDSNYNKAAVDELNRVINDLLAQMDTLNEQKAKAKEQIDALDKLSQEEKNHYKDLIDKAGSKDAIDQILRDAQTNNSNKEQLINAIDTDPAYQYLNEKQKEAVKEEIKNSNNISINDSTLPSTTDVINKAKELDDAMHTLKDLVGAKVETNQTPYNDANEDSKNKYNNLIHAGDDLGKSVNPDETLLDNKITELHDTANWNKTAVDQLINAIKEAQKTLSNSAIDNLDNLSQEEKDHFNYIVNDPSSTPEQIKAAVEKAKEINQTKETKINEIRNNPEYEHLNQSQKDAAIQAIKNSNVEVYPDASNPTLAKVLEDTKALDDSMEKLANLVTKSDAVKKSNAYLGATDQTKNNYNQAIDAAKELQNNTNPDVSQLDGVDSQDDANWNKNAVEKLINKIENALKSAAIDTINKLPNLTNSEKETLINDINNPDNNTPEKIQEIVDKGKELNDKKQAAIDTINQKSNLSDEEKAKLTKDIKAVDYLGNLDDSSKDNELTNLINDAKRINDAKQAKIDAINTNYEHLNDSQKEQVKKDIIASNLENITNAENELTSVAEERANNLNNAMKALKDALADSKAVQKQNDFINSNDEELKDKLQRATNAGDKLVVNTNPTADDLANLDHTTPQDDANWNKEAVDNLTADLKTLIKALKDNVIDNLPNLSYDEKTNFKEQIKNANNQNEIEEIVQKAKNDNQSKGQIIEQIKKLPHLNDTQKETLINELKESNLNPIDSSDNATSNEVLEKAKELNDLMSKLKELNDIAKEVIDENDFDKVPEDKQEQLTNTSTISDNLLNNQEIDQNAKEVTSLNDVTKDANKEQVAKVIEKLTNNLKDVAKAEIDNLIYLNDAEKTALKAQLDVKDTATGEQIKNILDRAKEINDKKKAAIETIKNKEFLSDAEKNQLIDEVNELDYGNSTNDQDNDAKLAQILDKVTNLDKNKENIANNINDLANINNSQKIALIKELKASNFEAIENSNNESSSDVEERANQLNDTMGELKELNNNAANIKTSDLYSKASDDSKENYENYIDAANDLINDKKPNAEKIVNIDDLNAPENANWNNNQVSKLVDAIKNALKEALNNALDNFDNLSDDEKTKLKDELDKSSSPEGFNEVINDAEIINSKKQMEIDNLSNNYPHLDKGQLDALKDAIKKSNLDPNLNKDHQNVDEIKEIAKNLDKVMDDLNKLNNDTNVDQSTIDNIKKIINSVKDSLVNKDKNSAQNAINKAQDAIKKARQIYDLNTNLNDLIEKFKKSNAFNEVNKVIKKELLSKVEELNNILRNIDQSIKNVLIAEINNANALMNKASNYVQVVDALLNKDPNIFDENIYNLANNDTTYQNSLIKLATQLRFKNYFNNFDKNDKNKLTAKDLDIDLDSLPKVIATALNLKSKAAAFLIPIILFMGAILTFGIVAAIAKKKSKKQ